MGLAVAVVEVVRVDSGGELQTDGSGQRTPHSERVIGSWPQRYGHVDDEPRRVEADEYSFPLVSDEIGVPAPMLST